MKLKKTTLELPEILWHAAKYRAGIEHIDLRDVVARALEDYVKTPLRPALRARIDAKKAVAGEMRYIDLFPEDLRSYIKSVYVTDSGKKEGKK